jgi:hypothetical protein
MVFGGRGSGAHDVLAVAITKCETVAHLHPTSRTLPGCELQHGTSPTLGCNPPGTEVLDDLEHPELAV